MAPPRRRFYSSANPHLRWYSDIFPAVVPVAILASAVYMGLHLLQAKLSHEKFTLEAQQRIQELEHQLELERHARQAQRTSQIKRQQSKWLWW